ncbi:hypothetical protein BCR42DRAFT_418022 [Absidia repens]|uniref:Uncharacterized protein n=1 Tax=Absidia repens TaxID=90262 RepID=A0A1X2ICX8_9FUNG|nr:hypothetical protein BCR42DRAFT_418022 [Absidia repens]
MSVDNRPWPLSEHLSAPPSLRFHSLRDESEKTTTPSLPTQNANQQDRKRSRVTSLQLCYSRAWLGQGHIHEYHLTPEEKVRRAIDTVVDNGYEQVDLSHCDLIEIPEGIAELQHITVLRKDTVKTASLQLYLFANQLKSLSPTLFQLKNLSVLSLRCNKLTFLPPDIAFLENLVELSLGNNNLTYLPSEIRKLPKLTLLSVCPNPFLQKPITNEQQQQSSIPSLTLVRPGYLCHSLPSLFEIAGRQQLLAPTLQNKEQNSRTMVNNKNNGTRPSSSLSSSPMLPWTIQQRLDSVSSINRCHVCKQPFLDSTTQEMIWMDIINVKLVPLLHRFCSVSCSQQLTL